MQAGARPVTDTAAVIKGAVKLSEYVRKVNPQVQLSGGYNGKYRCPCIIHGGDNKTAMTIDDRLGLWKCFTGDCGGGSIIDLYMKLHSITEFSDAITGLGGELNVQLPEREHRGPSRSRIVDAMNAVMDESLDFLLGSRDPAASAARRYLKSRGMNSKKLLERWGIGMLPSGKDALKFVKTAADGDIDALVAGGVVGGERNDWVQLNGRLLFPIFDRREDVIAFGGRQIPDVTSSGQGKYVNGPHTSLYDKSAVLYGAHLLRDTTDTVTVSEGYLDTIAINEAMREEGLSTVGVATCGTAITSGHLKALSSISNLTLVLDGDAAGKKAVVRSLWLSNVTRASMNVVILDDDQDPWDIYSEDPEEGHLVEVIDRGVPLVDATMNLQIERFAENRAGFDAWIREAASTLTHQSDRDALMNAAASHWGQNVIAYKRNLSVPDTKVVQLPEAGDEVQLSPNAAALISALLSMNENQRAGVLAVFTPWTRKVENAIRDWLPISTDTDVSALRRLVLGMGDHEGANMDRVLARLIPTEGSVDLGAVTRSVVSGINPAFIAMGDRGDDDTITLSRLLRRSLTASRNPEYQVTCLATAIDSIFEASRLADTDSGQKSIA